MTREPQEHRALALRAAACAERVLALFERERPDDRRPCEAIEAGRGWVRGERKMAVARAAAFAAHADPREVEQEAACAAARAAGPVYATTHVATQAPRAASVTLNAVETGLKAVAAERDWQHHTWWTLR